MTRHRADSLAAAIGGGLLSGLAGTAAMTVSSTIEMRLSGREPSRTPGTAAGTLLHVRPQDAKGEQRFGGLAHWAYGTLWGLARPVVHAFGLRGWQGALCHGTAVLTAEQALLPALGAGSPTPCYGLRPLGIDTLHHAVYAAVAVLAHERLFGSRAPRRR
ncbi:hypothetical protein [Sciscionella sediminilitoris]|uniref:hypothetical protein n=1 Tax=Sciscionella sediminilitoris TaxID=1445613 RepID=UPI0004DFB42F|nr:hypothetical protein [Sciscionella sp. SE31]